MNGKVLFTSKHDDNAPVTRVHVSLDEAETMQVFYRRLGFMTGIGGEPEPRPIRIATRNRGSTRQRKVGAADLVSLISAANMSADEKVAMITELMKRIR